MAGAHYAGAETAGGAPAAGPLDHRGGTHSRGRSCDVLVVGTWAHAPQAQAQGSDRGVRERDAEGAFDTAGTGPSRRVGCRPGADWQPDPRPTAGARDLAGGDRRRNWREHLDGPAVGAGAVRANAAVLSFANSLPWTRAVARASHHWRAAPGGAPTLWFDAETTRRAARRRSRLGLQLGGWPRAAPPREHSQNRGLLEWPAAAAQEITRNAFAMRSARR